MLWARAFEGGDAGCCFVVPQVALCTYLRPWHGACREAAPGKALKRSFGGVRVPCEACRPWA
eukprot:348653-Alexandrium_andersonii.AAC.1